MLIVPSHTDQHESLPVTCLDPRLHIETELTKLEALSADLAARHLGWRLIEAFVARDPEQLLFWSMAFAKFEGTDDAAIVSQVLSTTVGECRN